LHYICKLYMEVAYKIKLHIKLYIKLHIKLQLYKATNPPSTRNTLTPWNPWAPRPRTKFVQVVHPEVHHGAHGISPKPFSMEPMAFVQEHIPKRIRWITQDSTTKAAISTSPRKHPSRQTPVREEIQSHKTSTKHL
jgi:hypothetical protein